MNATTVARNELNIDNIICLRETFIILEFPRSLTCDG